MYLYIMLVVISLINQLFIKYFIIFIDSFVIYFTVYTHNIPKTGNMYTIYFDYNMLILFSMRKSKTKMY